MKASKTTKILLAKKPGINITFCSTGI